VRFHRIIEYKCREQWNWLHVGVCENYIQDDNTEIYLHNIGCKFMTLEAARALADALYEAANKHEAKYDGQCS
jgi:hypothetical protein